MTLEPKSGYYWGGGLSLSSFSSNIGYIAGGFGRSGDKITIHIYLDALGTKSCYVNFKSMGHGTAPSELELAPGQSILGAIGGESNKSLAWIDPADDLEMTGWYKENTFQNEVKLTDPITGDTTLYAKWEPVKCTLTFAHGGGSGSMEDALVEKNGKYTLPACTFTAPEGKEFDKWDCGEPGDELTVLNDMQVIALWKDMPAVTFDADGGSGSMEKVSVETGKEFSLPPCTFTAPAGKVFDRWDKGSTGLPGEKITITGDITIKAVWKDKPADPDSPETPQTPISPGSPDESAAGDVKAGDVKTVSSQDFTVITAATASEAGTVTYTKAPNKKNVTVPKTIKIGEKTYKVTAISAKAFTAKKIRKVTIGANVEKIAKNAFKGSKATTLVLKTKLLTKKSVKGSLKSSKVKTVQVKVGAKKTNKKYIKSYKKFFTKKNAGRKASVK